MAELQVKRRPIRAALYGLMLGFSIWYFLQFEFATFSFDSVGGIVTRAVIVIVVVMALSVAWAYLAPPKKPKGAAPAAAEAMPAPTPAETEQPDDGPPLPVDDE
jgi:hypothetical protein